MKSEHVYGMIVVALAAASLVVWLAMLRYV